MPEEFTRHCPQCGAPEGGCHCNDVGLGAPKEQPAAAEETGVKDEVIVRELKERARQEFEKTVQPLINELRAQVRRFPDLSQEFTDAFEKSMKNAETFFSLEDCYQSLNSQGWVDELSQMHGWLKEARSAREFQNISDSRIAEGRGATIIFQEFWFGPFGRMNWENVARTQKK